MTSSGQSSAGLPAEIGLTVGEILLSIVIIFGPLAFGSVEPWASAVLQGLILLLGAVVSLHCARAGVVPPMGVAALAGVVALIGFLQTMNVHDASGVNGGWISSTSGFCSSRLAFMWTCFAVLGASASAVLSRPAARVRFAWTVFLVGAIISFIGIVQHAQGNTFYYGLRPVRNGIPFGPYTNYNHAASLMSAALCMGMGLIFAPLTETRGRLTDRVPVQALIFAIMGLIFFGILKTGSRAGLAALGVGAGAFVCGLWLLGRWRLSPGTQWLAVLLAGTAAVGVFFNPGGHRFALSAIAHGAAFRAEIYRNALSALSDFPVFGIGLGAIPAAMHPYQTVWVGRLLESAHSDILDGFLQIGMAGTIAILGFALSLAAKTLVQCRMDRTSAAVLRLSSFAACGVFLAHGFLESNLRIPANAALIVAVLAFASTTSASTATAVSSGSAPLRSYGFALTSVVIAAMVFVPFRAAHAASVFRRAIERPSDDSLVMLREAIRLDARPEYQFALAVELANSADRAASDRVLLRQALSASAAALKSFPYHQPYRGLHASILTKLGRGRDASEFPI